MALKKIQWSGVVVTPEQYDAMNDPFKNVLGASLVDARHGHGLIAMPNSSILEMYRPDAPRTPWRNAGQPLAIRFDTHDLYETIAKLQAHGLDIIRNYEGWETHHGVQFKDGVHTVPSRVLRK